jgi:mxaJ protein
MTTSGSMQTWLRVLALAALIVVPFAARADIPELRVCADPNKLPFSNSRGEGLENKIAELIARPLPSCYALSRLSGH